MKLEEAVFLNLEDYIPIGHEQAVSREYLCKITGMTDRMLRKVIELSDLPIVNMGYGYFIPDMDDEIDRHETNKYIAQEQSRIRAIENRLERKFSDIILNNDNIMENDDMVL